MNPLPPPPIITHARDLLAGYDVVFCDVWGVVHDGIRANAGAMRALTSFRARGGTVILVSNAPVPPGRVAEMLDVRAVPRTAWDDIVSSGGIALRHVADQGYGAVACIGPRDRDAAFFERLTAREVSLEEAEALVCTGLEDDTRETVEDYRALLEGARARALPFVCANPDLVVDVGGELFLCAGAIAAAYETIGGSVYWAGKPHPVAFETALERAEALRGEPLGRERILAIGDALRTDLRAAEGMGIDGLFVASGIHRSEAMTGEAIDRDKLLHLLSREAAPPVIAAMAWLDW